MTTAIVTERHDIRRPRIKPDGPGLWAVEIPDNHDGYTTIATDLSHPQAHALWCKQIHPSGRWPK